MSEMVRKQVYLHRRHNLLLKRLAKAGASARPRSFVKPSIGKRLEIRPSLLIQITRRGTRFLHSSQRARHLRRKVHPINGGGRMPIRSAKAVTTTLGTPTLIKPSHGVLR